MAGPFSCQIPDSCHLAKSMTPSRAYSFRLFSLLAICGAVMLLGGFAVLSSLSLGPSAWSTGAPIELAAETEAAPEAAAPFTFRADIAPAQAAKINSAILKSNEPIIPAKPFAILAPSATAQSQRTAVDCLTAAIYYEAASETNAGQRAVAQVVLNRVRHPAYPNSVCEVVFQGSDRKTGCQFTFTCDGALARRPTAYGWARARSVAIGALSGSVERSVGLATHYHTQWVVPYWSGGLTKLGSVGAHIFYRWNGRYGSPGTFSSRYSGLEAIPPHVARQLTGYVVGTPGPSLVVEDIGQMDDGLSRAGQKVGAAPLVAAPRGELSSAAPASMEAKNGQLRQPDYRIKDANRPRMLIADQGKLIDKP